MARVAAYGIGLSVVLAAAWPGFREPTRDSYPLSTYPMFARPREKPLLYFAEGIAKGGRRVRLPPELVANQEVMQAAARVRRAVAAGDDAAAELCKGIAARTAASGQHRSVLEVQLVGARFDPVAYFTGAREPEARVVHQRCRVRRRR